MKNRNFNSAIVMTWRFVAIGLMLALLTCFLGTGCTSLQGKGGKSNSLSFPPQFQSSKSKPKKVKKTANNSKTLEEVLGWPRS
ncbi:MAG: hypothetical protein LBJ00_09880 [Planctomycetaceae bacterium]|jgi:hypothetical protein|nr:hypothetical protein [Planctomycetaceae bacterium]